MVEKWKEEERERMMMRKCSLDKNGKYLDLNWIISRVKVEKEDEDKDRNCMIKDDEK